MSNIRSLCVASLLAGACLYSTGCEMPEDVDDPTDTVSSSQPGFAEGDEGTILWDFGGGEASVHYKVIQGHVVTGGDMVLGTVDEVLDRTAAGFRLYGSFASENSVGWPGNRINYFIDADVHQSNRYAIMGAIANWEAASTFYFVRRYIIEPGVHTLVFKTQRAGPSAPVCSATVGYQGTGTQSVWLTPKACTAGPVTHEIGHALGLGHEHQRRDRQSFIGVDMSAVPRDSRHNFEANQYGWGDYNYSSVTHYVNSVYTTADGAPMMLVKDCDDASGDSPTGVSCRLGADVPNTADAAALLRVNHGANVRAFRLRNKHSNKCLRPDASGELPVAGNGVHSTTDCAWSSESGRWYKSTNAHGQEILINKGGRVCLSAYDGEPGLYVEGAPQQEGITVQQCGQFQDSVFNLVPAGRGYYQIRQGSQCLIDEGYVRLSTCDSANSRKWKLDY